MVRLDQAIKSLSVGTVNTARCLVMTSSKKETSDLLLL